ncbi:MAG: hypothetical protein ABIP35_10420 [Ginsengibacter sp.]
MKKYKIIYSLSFLLILSTGCLKKNGIDDDLSFLNTAASANVAKVFDISNDNSGNVKITPTGEGVSSFSVTYGQGTGTPVVLKPGESTMHSYPEGAYTVSIMSKDVAGHETTTTFPLTVTYRAPENIDVTFSKAAHVVKVKASALYAASYMVYYGDVQNETGTPLATGAELTHTYANAGLYNVKVVALSGGAAKSEKITPLTVFDPFQLPIDFDNAFVDYFFGTFGGGQQFAKVANPNKSGINTSDNVGKFTRGFEGWSGTYSPLNAPIKMASGKKITVMVYNPNPSSIGAMLNVELESGTISNGIAVLKVPVTKSGVWEELVFDFSTIANIPADATFNQLVLRFNDATTGDVTGGTGTIIYLDNFKLTN